jgi:phosphonopyruvate decarboxylase
MISRKQAILEIFKNHPDSFFIVSTGYISRAVFELFPDNENIFYMQGSMGIAPAIGLGLASQTDQDIVVISGDGSLLMHLGITHTIRDMNLSNLFNYVLDNGTHESVGAYPVSHLEEGYPGIDKIFKITNDGKPPRVGMDFITNKECFIKKLKGL